MCAIDRASPMAAPGEPVPSRTDVTPSCSSNGDAAASLAALFAESAPFSAGKGAPSEGAPEAMSGSSSSSSAASAEALNKQQAAWRVKFLQKVGAVPSKQQNPEGSAAMPQDAALPEQAGPAPPDEEDLFGDIGDGDETNEEAVPVNPAPRRSDADIRREYIKKLEQSRAFIPQLNRPKRSQTVTIFDWDDTLLCTSEHSAARPAPHLLRPSFVTCSSPCVLGCFALPLARPVLARRSPSDACAIPPARPPRPRPLGNGAAAIWGHPGAGTRAACIHRAHRQVAPRAGGRSRQDVHYHERVLGLGATLVQPLHARPHGGACQGGHHFRARGL